MAYDFSGRNKAVITNRNERLKRNKLRNIPPNIVKEKPSEILLTGGIGDVLALESHFNNNDRNKLETIYYATNKSKQLMELFKSFYNFPRLKNHIVVWNDFSKFWCFFTKDDCIIHLKTIKADIPGGLVNAEDWGIVAKFPKIGSGVMNYTGSSAILGRLCRVDDFDLPDKYMVVCPYTTDKREPTRDFTDEDWQKTLTILRRRDMQGVILNRGMDIVPKYSEIIDLNNKTSIAEAIEILKKSSGYIGINSALSVLAAQLFNYPNLYIKNTGDHCARNKQIYYAPQKDFKFLMKEISCD